MGSEHQGHHHHGHQHHSHQAGGCKGASLKNIRWAFALNFVFTIIEIIGGYLTGSVAVLSDAVHDAGDTLSLGLALFLEGKAQEGPTQEFSYGKKRLSLLSAVISGVVITAGSSLVLWASVPKIFNPGEPHGVGMMGLALLGIAMNGFAAWKLKSQGTTQNEKVLTWHLMEDALGWTAVLVGGGLIYLFELYWIDPLLAAAIAIFIIFNVVRELYRSVTLLLQASPNPQKLTEFIDIVKKENGVMDVHDVHYWSLDGSSHVLSLHIVSPFSGPNLIELKTKIRALTDMIGSPHTTIEVETSDEDCADNCNDNTAE